MLIWPKSNLNAVLLNEIKPSLFLTEYIRLYRIVHFHFPSGIPLPVKAYPPRPELCLYFFPGDPDTVKYPNAEQMIISKQISLIGQQTLVNFRHVPKDFLLFQVVFQPCSFFQLTDIPADELTNLYLDAEDIFGRSIKLVNEQLFHARNYFQMIRIVEEFLTILIRNKNKKIDHPVDEISKMMIHEEEEFSLDKFLKTACLSHRQFDRKFKERIGLSPKQYLEIIRFDKAFRMKNRYPEKDWLSIALHCGYHDYQHLTKGYKEFTGYTPVQFYEIDKQAPERTFGEAEI
jgi:AraC-like DNA-binding protein